MTPNECRKVAREKYQPPTIKILFIAEAPPLNDNRYFYFENMTEGDGFYLEMMKALYGKERIESACLRKHKAQFLSRFKDDGFHLIDSCVMPLMDTKRKYKETEIKKNLPDLKNRINGITDNDTKIILILATVYEICRIPLLESGFSMINTESIPFPGFGHQKKFREKLRKLLFKKCDYTIPSPDWMPEDCKTA